MTPSPESVTSADAPPSQEQPPPRSRRPRPPLFRGETPADPPADPTLSPHDQPAMSAGEKASASGSPDAEPKSPGPRPRASSVSPSDRRQLKAAIKAGVQLVGVQLHNVAVADELEADAGLWLTDEQDQEGIAEPLSSIVARRGGPGVVNPDLGDAIAALIALVAYISKQLDLRAKIRRIRRGQPVDVGAEMNGQAAPPAA